MSCLDGDNRSKRPPQKRARRKRSATQKKTQEIGDAKEECPRTNTARSCAPPLTQRGALSLSKREKEPLRCVGGVVVRRSFGGGFCDRRRRGGGGRFFVPSTQVLFLPLPLLPWLCSPRDGDSVNAPPVVAASAACVGVPPTSSRPNSFKGMAA